MKILKTMYKLSGDSIGELRIVSETEKTVTYLTGYNLERKEFKNSVGVSWHNTLMEAQEQRISNLEKEKSKCLLSIEYSKKAIEAIDLKIKNYKTLS